jgi:hypothetical protein
MDINSQHHNLLGNKILPKSEDFCILAPILNPKWLPYQTKMVAIWCSMSYSLVAAFGGLEKIKMAAVAMVTKVQKMLNSLRTADPFET